MARKAPTTAEEAATILQDAKDLRDDLVRRFDAGDPPAENEYQEGLNRLDYAMRSHQGLVAKEKAEAEDAAAKKAQALRKKFRNEVGKNVEVVISAQENVVKALITLITAASFTNQKADGIKAQVAELRPADIPLDAPAPQWQADALKFGGFPAGRVVATPLIRAAVHEALSRFAKDLTYSETEWLRSLEGPSAVRELHDTKQRLNQVDRTSFDGKAEHKKPADAGPTATRRSA